MNRNDQQNAGNAENNYVKQGQEVSTQDHIEDILKKETKNPQDFGWLDELLTEFALKSKVLLDGDQYFDKLGEPQEGTNLLNTAKAAIQAHFTAREELCETANKYCAERLKMMENRAKTRAKQHQADLLRAHIKELDEISSVMARTPKHIQYYRKRKDELQAELAKLENVK